MQSSDKKTNSRRQGYGLLGVLLLTVALGGCVVEGGGGHSRGWCWWHPRACGR